VRAAPSPPVFHSDQSSLRKLSKRHSEIRETHTALHFRLQSFRGKNNTENNPAADVIRRGKKTSLLPPPPPPPPPRYPPGNDGDDDDDHKWAASCCRNREQEVQIWSLTLNIKTPCFLCVISCRRRGERGYCSKVERGRDGSNRRGTGLRAGGENRVVEHLLCACDGSGSPLLRGAN